MSLISAKPTKAIEARRNCQKTKYVPKETAPRSRIERIAFGIERAARKPKLVPLSHEEAKERLKLALCKGYEGKA